MLNNSENKNYLIFTDLDGTLLDHDTYSFHEADEMLKFIRTNEIPLIIVTSKTKEEVIKLQEHLEINSPFIVENGAGMFIPNETNLEKISLGKSYQEILNNFNKYSKTFDMRGFHQMSDDEVAKLTSLPLEKAKLARKRDFCEPFILADESSKNELKQLALADGLDVVKGGRFFHLITKGQDKANAVLQMKKTLEELNSKTYKTIALGDGENDITMLSVVDFPILIKKYDGTFIDFEKENLRKTKFIGPKGWNESLKEILCTT